MEKITLIRVWDKPKYKVKPSWKRALTILRNAGIVKDWYFMNGILTIVFPEFEKPEGL